MAAALPALDPAAGPQLAASATPIGLSAPQAGVEEIFDDVEDEFEPSLPAAPAVLPDRRAAAAVVAARPPGTAIGYLLIDLASGQELAELNPDLPLIPASTAKLATAVVALDVLGSEYRFRTELLTNGRVERGVLRGDLILRGSGDPALDVPDLLGLAVRLESSGIREVDGRFLIDDTAMPRFSEIEPTQPPQAPYNASVGALSLAFNRVHVAWWGGGRIDVAALPPLQEARFEGAPPGQLPPGGIELLSNGQQSVVWRVADRGRRRQVTELPVKDPGLHAGYVFRQLAGAQGISLMPPLRGATPAGAVVLAVHESPPLRYLVQDMLLYSNNVMAELIGLAAAQRLGNAWDGLDVAGDLLLASSDHAPARGGLARRRARQPVGARRHGPFHAPPAGGDRALWLAARGAAGAAAREAAGRARSADASPARARRSGSGPKPARSTMAARSPATCSRRPTAPRSS